MPDSNVRWLEIQRTPLPSYSTLTEAKAISGQAKRNNRARGCKFERI